MSGPPTLALVAPRQPAGFLPLVAAMSAWCRPVARGQEDTGPPAAVFCTDPAWVPDTDVPLAVWVADTDELAQPACPRAVALVTADPALRTGLGARGLVVPPVAGPGVPGYLPPFVRSRVRRARGLVAEPVVRHDGHGWRWPGRAGPLDQALTETALSVAAVAVATEPEAVETALGYGTPTVTDYRCAALLGAKVGRDVCAADEPDGRDELAAEVAAAADLAASLSWRGRQLFLRRHGVSHAAASLAGRLLGRGDTAGHALLHTQLRLAELGTPATATVRGRMHAALAALVAVTEPAR